MKKQSLSSPPHWGLMATVRQEIAEATADSSPFLLLRGKLTLRAVVWLVQDHRAIKWQVWSWTRLPWLSAWHVTFIHAESVWYLCSYHSRTVSYHHHLLEIPQVKGRVPSKAAFTSDASCKFWVSPGHLHLTISWLQIQGSYNLFRFDDSLEWPTELRKALLFIVTVVL